MVGRVPGITASVVIGGFLCVSISFLVVAATIVLSLISLYLPNRSEEGYGEYYQIKTLMIKALYQDSSFTFNGGPVADSVAMSILCSSVYQSYGANNFAGCIAQNFRAFGPYNSSTGSRRRRRAPQANVGLYEIGEINIYYSTSCASKADTSKYASFEQLSYCVKQRLTACNNLVNGSSNFIEWRLLPGGFSQMIVDQYTYSYQPVNIQRIFGIPFAKASSLAGNLGISGATTSSILLGCQFIRPLSQAEIAAALSAQTTVTTTLPTSTNALFV